MNWSTWGRCLGPVGRLLELNVIHLYGQKLHVTSWCRTDSKLSLNPFWTSVGVLWTISGCLSNNFQVCPCVLCYTGRMIQERIRNSTMWPVSLWSSRVVSIQSDMSWVLWLVWVCTCEQDSSSADKIERLKKDLEESKQILQKSVDAILERCCAPHIVPYSHLKYLFLPTLEPGAKSRSVSENGFYASLLLPQRSVEAILDRFCYPVTCRLLLSPLSIPSSLVIRSREPFELLRHIY